MTYPPSHPKAEKYALMSKAQLAELSVNIRTNGQQKPIIFSDGPASPGLLIDGRNRWLACELADVSPKIEQKAFESEADIIAFIERENDLRRHDSPEDQERHRKERYARAVELRQEGKSYRQIGEQLGEPEANVRRDLKKATASRDAVELPGITQGKDGKKRKSRQIAGKCGDATCTRKTWLGAGFCSEHAASHAIDEETTTQESGTSPSPEASVTASLKASGPLDPKTMMPIRAAQPKEGARATSVARAEHSASIEANRLVKHSTIANGTKALARPGQLGPFSLLLVDPPWQHDVKISEAKKTENHYPTMTLEDLAMLPVSSICADQAVLYLWVTAPHAREAFILLDGWGFTYKSQHVWYKVGRTGMGHWSRVDHELVYVATRGNFPTPSTVARQSSVTIAKPGKHSEKPKEFQAWLSSAYAEHPKVELFARKQTKGWTCVGNEIDGRDIREVLANAVPLEDGKQRGLPFPEAPSIEVPKEEELPNDWLVRGLKEFEQCDTKEKVKAVWSRLYDQATNESEHEAVEEANYQRLQQLKAEGKAR